MVSTSKYPSSSITSQDYDNGSQLESPQDYSRVPSDLFIAADITDKMVETTVMNPIIHNLFDKQKSAFIRFHSNKCVNNPMLYANFERYREKLKADGINPQEVYAFMQLPNGDHGEEDELCAYGVRVGMNYRGELGDASKGVYLSSHPDTCTPSAFINDQCLRILICKVLLGRSRRVLPSPNPVTWTNAPDANYNSYVAFTPDLSKFETASPLMRYINSLIYVYEFVGKQTTSERPSSIFPLSVVEIQCNKPGPDFLNILVPRNMNSTVWTGTLHLQKYLLKHVTMHSHFTSVGRPRGLDNLQFKVTIPYDTVANCLPIKRLLQEDMIGALLQRPEIVFEDQMTPMYLQYFTIKCDECEQFDGLCTLMRKFELVGVNKLPSGTHLFLIPNGGLSLKLGLCLFNTASFHCISISNRSANMANINWQADPFDSKLNAPPARSMMNMETINARFRQSIPPPIPINSGSQVQSPINSTPPIISPMNFSVPPPDFSQPPPPIQSRLTREISPLSGLPFTNLQQPVPTTPTEFKRIKLEVMSQPPVNVNVPPPGMISTSRLSNASTNEKVEATSRGMDRLLSELTTKPTATFSSIDSTTKNRLDPRLANQKALDPRRPDSFTRKPMGNSTPIMSHNVKPSTSLKIEDRKPFNEDAHSVLNSGRWSDSKPLAKRARSQSSDSDEGGLQIDEGSPVKETKNIVKKTAESNTPEDIDLRDFRQVISSRTNTNGHQSNNTTSSSANRGKASRFGPQTQNVRPPSLIDLSHLPSKPQQFMSPPPLGPPRLETNQSYDISKSPPGVKKIVVIPDPDLFISPVLSPDDLKNIFATASEINKRVDSKISVVFKWHSCINTELQRQIKETPPNSLLSNRARKYIEIEQKYIELIESLSPHLCDLNSRNAQKFLICCLNVKRADKNERIVFMSAVINSQSTFGSNFANEKIELKSPDEMIKYLRSDVFSL